MASDSAVGGWNSGKRISVNGFQWVSSAPSPAAVARLEDSFPEVVSIPAAELEAEVASWQNTSILARTYNKWIPAEAMIREFRRAGIPGEIVPLSLAFRCHIFRFASLEARNLALNRPWVVNGQLVGTEAWRAEFIPAEDSIPTALVWVRLPSLPLEFWKEAFIRAILEPAGEFLCVDAATKAMNRGGFARACLRIDLRRPLRPGVRVQGSYLPFWQQIIYESLDGVCLRCGSLHLGVPCLHPESSGDGEVDAVPVFGSWLVAVRQRKAAPGPSSVDKGKAQVNSSSAPSASSPASPKRKDGLRPGSSRPDDWISPVKTVRRRPSPASKKASALAKGKAQSVVEAEACVAVKDGVPVRLGRAGTVHSECSEMEAEMGVKLGGGEVHSDLSANPFAALALADGGEVQSGSKDAYPAPLKRARAEVSLPPRSISKLDKHRGKGKVHSAMSVGVFRSSPSQANQPPSSQEGPLVMSHSEGGDGFISIDVVCTQGPQADVEGIAGEGQSASSSLLSPVVTSADGVIVDCVMREDKGRVPASSTL